MKIPCLDDAENYESSGQIETVPEDQVSLLEETITPRHNLPPLLHKLSERKPERLDWIGKKFFHKYNFVGSSLIFLYFKDVKKSFFIRFS